MSAANDAHTMYNELPPAEKKKFQALASVAPLEPVSGAALNYVWYMVIGTLAIVLLGSLGVEAWLVDTGKSTSTFSPIVTLVLGIFGGLLGPQPAKTKSA